jgi:DNA-binding LacI/PurR family transcriptional regulator
MSSVTIRDVAQAAGVSIATVSDVLRPKPRFRYRAETVAQVNAAVERLGYRAHSAARLLRQHKTKLVGVAIDVHTLSLSPVVRAVYEELERHNYEPVLLEARQLMPGSGHQAFPSPEILAGLLSVDLVLEGNPPAFYKELRQKLPLIALYPVRSKIVDCVTTDRALAIEMAIEHLVQLGHRQIAFAQQSTPGIPSTEAKRLGWKRGIAKQKLEQSDVHELRLPPAVSVMQSVSSLAELLPTLRPRPTALICSGDVVAFGIVSALGKAGWSLPDQLSVVGFGSNHYGQFSQPELTTLEEPYTHIAQAAVARLIALIESPRDEATLRPLHQLLAPKLIVRQSTAPPGCKVQSSIGNGPKRKRTK